MTIAKDLPKWTRTLILLGIILFSAGFLGYTLDVTLPVTPALEKTLTPATTPPPSAIGSYDVLGHVISATEAESLLQTETGKTQLSPEQGTVAVTPDLIQLGRQEFYEQTFGNERFITDVVGALNVPCHDRFCMMVVLRQRKLLLRLMNLIDSKLLMQPSLE
ncbi:MAG TPA: hypothetical protein V6C65_32305 [Allocoleopsis sp.]